MTPPQLERLGVEGRVIVAGEDRERQPVERDAQFGGRGQELEAHRDGLFLEVVAEGPVAQHLEEREVHGIADFVDVAGADAFLVVGEAFARRMRLSAQVRDQRMHPGGGEEAGRVVVRDQRRALYLGVSVAAEKCDISAADLCCGHGDTMSSLKLVVAH